MIRNILNIVAATLSCFVIPFMYFNFISVVYIKLIGEIVNKTNVKYFLELTTQYIFLFVVMNIYSVIHSIISSKAISIIQKTLYKNILNTINNLDMSSSKINYYCQYVKKNVITINSLLRSIFMIWLPCIVDILITVFYSVYIKNYKILFLVMFWLFSQLTTIYLFIIKNKQIRTINNSSIVLNSIISETIDNSIITKLYKIQNFNNKNIRPKIDHAIDSNRSLIVKTYIFKTCIHIYGIVIAIFIIYLSYISDMNIEQRSKLNLIIFNTIKDMNRLINFIIPNLEFISNFNNPEVQAEIEDQNIGIKIDHIKNIYIDTININHKIFKICTYIGLGLNILKGKNGCGKTQLINKMSGLYRCNDKIYYNDQQLCNISLSSIRDCVVTLTQSDYIYNKPTRENICLSDNIDDEVYNRVIQECKINDNDLLHSNNNVVASGGQKRIISIARMLYRLYTANNRCLVLLDEPFNNLDLKYIISMKNIVNNISKQHIVIVVDHNDYVQSNNIINIL